MEKGTEPFIVFGQPYIQDSEIQEVVDTLQSKWIGTGPRVAIFQKNLSRYIGADHVAPMNSCTPAKYVRDRHSIKRMTKTLESIYDDCSYD